MNRKIIIFLRLIRNKVTTRASQSHNCHLMSRRKSRRGISYDNAACESFMKTLKLVPLSRPCLVARGQGIPRPGRSGLPSRGSSRRSATAGALTRPWAIGHRSNPFRSTGFAADRFCCIGNGGSVPHYNGSECARELQDTTQPDSPANALPDHAHRSAVRSGRRADGPRRVPHR